MCEDKCPVGVEKLTADLWHMWIRGRTGKSLFITPEDVEAMLDLWRVAKNAPPAEDGDIQDTASGDAP